MQQVGNRQQSNLLNVSYQRKRNPKSELENENSRPEFNIYKRLHQESEEKQERLTHLKN